MTKLNSWAEVYQRFEELLCDRASAHEWVRQALEAAWGAQDIGDLNRIERSVALQRVSGVLWKIAGAPGDVAFMVDGRSIVRAAFARYFGGVVLDGPPWRMSPAEDRPTYEEWLREASEAF